MNSGSPMHDEFMNLADDLAYLDEEENGPTNQTTTEERLAIPVTNSNQPFLFAEVSTVTSFPPPETSHHVLTALQAPEINFDPFIGNNQQPQQAIAHFHYPSPPPVTQTTPTTTTAPARTRLPSYASTRPINPAFRHLVHLQHDFTRLEEYRTATGLENRIPPITTTAPAPAPAPPRTRHPRLPRIRTMTPARRQLVHQQRDFTRPEERRAAADLESRIPPPHRYPSAHGSGVSRYTTIYRGAADYIQFLEGRVAELDRRVTELEVEVETGEMQAGGGRGRGRDGDGDGDEGGEHGRGQRLSDE